MDWMFWVWIVLAAVLIVGEMFTAGFFLLVFGIGAVASAVVTVLGGAQAAQWIAFVVVSALAYAGTRPFARRMHRTATDGVGADRYIGDRARVIETVDNDNATGMVRYQREQWRAEAVGDQVIPEGNWVEIVQVDGAHLIVRPAAPPEEASSSQAEDLEADARD